MNYIKEIGGYIELDRYNLPMIHSKAIALNCGRNCLLYLIRTKNIKKILLPIFLCDSVKDICLREKIEVRYYNIGKDFLPQNISLMKDEWLYVVNYYGQITDHIIVNLYDKYRNIILDQVQAFFQMPINNIDTIYSCRKFFGVPDGAFLYTETLIGEELLKDESYQRMNFLLGRFERNASDYYKEYVENNRLFESEPIKYMSELTKNLLHGIDYDLVRNRRTENYLYLYKNLKNINLLKLQKVTGAFMYPLYIKRGEYIRKQLLLKKIYIPTLWPEVIRNCQKDSLEYDMAQNILPLPCDQRYGREEMDYIIKSIIEIL